MYAVDINSRTDSEQESIVYYDIIIVQYINSKYHRTQYYNNDKIILHVSFYSTYKHSRMHTSIYTI